MHEFSLHIIANLRTKSRQPFCSYVATFKLCALWFHHSHFTYKVLVHKKFKSTHQRFSTGGVRSWARHYVATYILCFPIKCSPLYFRTLRPQKFTNSRNHKLTRVAIVHWQWCFYTWPLYKPVIVSHAMPAGRLSVLWIFNNDVNASNWVYPLNVIITQCI